MFAALLTLFLAAQASATALTYKLTPNAKECFYAHADKKDAKIAFYFAVQSGGSFDSAYTWDGEVVGMANADWVQQSTMSLQDLAHSRARSA